jgi:2-polyprenyl-3-methyl-5-hydroxy-6-metoxy-1,4-benzoquinol methylase
MENKDIKEIVKVMAQGSLEEAYNLCLTQGHLELAARIKRSQKHTTSLEEYKKLYESSWGPHYGEFENERGPGGCIRDNYKLDLRQEEALQQIVALPPMSRHKVLDVGCGDGSFLFSLLKREVVFEVVGVDAWKEGIAWAKEFGETTFPGKTTFYQGLFEEVAFSEHTFGVIHLGEILEHVISPLQVLRKAKSLLKPQGGIIITVPQDAPELTEEDIKMYTETDRVNQHIRHVGVKEIKGYAEALGMQVTRLVENGTAWKNLIATLQ